MKKIFLQTAIMASVGIGLVIAYLLFMGQVLCIPNPPVVINVLAGIISGAVGIVVSELVMNK